MKIESIALSNFRCFGPEGARIDLDAGVIALVGNNGSGKTALFAALSRLFGVTDAYRRVLRRDFHISSDALELVSGATLAVEVILAFPELTSNGGDTSAVPEFFTHMSASEPGNPLKVRIRLQATWTDDGTPEGTIDEQVRWVQTLDHQFTWDKCRAVTPHERATIQLIYVPVARNAAEPVTALLKGRLWRAARWSDSLRDVVTAGSKKIQTKFEGEAPTQFITERLQHRWQQLYEADTDAKPLLRLIDNTVRDLVRHAEFGFFPDEAGHVRDAAELSDGQRSLFHIALTAAILEVERDALALEPTESMFDQDKIRRTHLTILAIEEPENSLSPFFLSRIIAQAREIGAMASAQVLISSHSASILGRIEPEEVRYFRLDRKSRQSSIRPITLPPSDDEARRYVRLAARAYPELYFARFVILGEGDSERLVIPRISEAMGLPLDPSFVPIVPLGGRYVSHFWRLLNDLGIPHATLLDLDLGRLHGGAEAVRTAVAALAEIGSDLKRNPFVTSGKLKLKSLASLTDDDLCEKGHPWLEALAHEGVFFSDPIDLDFAMLEAFSAAYQHPNPGGRGPQLDPAAVEQKKRVTLKTGGKPELFQKSYDELFGWYPYLFLSHSKPERHLSALERLTVADLAANAPDEIKALIAHAMSTLDAADAGA